MTIETINSEEFYSKLTFQFTTKKLKRNVLLEEVLPIDLDMGYCAYLSNLNILVKKNMHDVENFDQLFGLFKIEKNFANLELIRKKYQIYEGNHLFDDRIKDVLSKISKNSNYVYIKCSEDSKTFHFWKINLNEFLHLKSFLNDLPINFGEFDFFDNSNNWFIKINADDPFIYLATKNLLIRQICEQHPSKFFLLFKTMLFSK